MLSQAVVVTPNGLIEAIKVIMLLLSYKFESWKYELKTDDKIEFTSSFLVFSSCQDVCHVC